MKSRILWSGSGMHQHRTHTWQENSFQFVNMWFWSQIFLDFKTLLLFFCRKRKLFWRNDRHDSGVGRKSNFTPLGLTPQWSMSSFQVFLQKLIIWHFSETCLKHFYPAVWKKIFQPSRKQKEPNIEGKKGSAIIRQKPSRGFLVMRILTGAHLFLPPVRSPSGWCHLWTGSASPALPVYRKQPVREAELCLNQIQSVWLLLTKLKARCSVRVRACVRRAPKQQILPQFLLLKLQLSLIWSLLHSDTCWWLVELFYAAILPSDSCVFKPVSLCVCFSASLFGPTDRTSPESWDPLLLPPLHTGTHPHIYSHLFPFYIRLSSWGAKVSTLETKVRPPEGLNGGGVQQRAALFKTFKQSASRPSGFPMGYGVSSGCSGCLVL